MGINPGALRHRVEVQSPVEGTPDAGAGVRVTWTTDAVVWARVEPLDGTKQSVGMAPLGTLTHRVTIRSRAGLTSKQRLRFGVRVLAIRSVLNIEERGELMELLCEESGR